MLRPLALLASLAAALGSASAAPTEYQIKGGYLYNFTHFVEWPNAAFSGPEDPFVIAVLDQDHVTPVIADVLAGKRTPNGRPIRVVHVSRCADIPPCQVLFVSRTVPADWREIRERIAGRPVLVVGEADGFAQHGGSINFVVAGDHFHMEINQRRAAALGLRLSGSLASISRLVRDAN